MEYSIPLDSDCEIFFFKVNSNQLFIIVKPFSELIVNWTPGNKLQWNSNQNTIIFIHIKTFEDVVCKMLANLFELLYVKVFPTGALVVPNFLLSCDLDTVQIKVQIRVWDIPLELILNSNLFKTFLFITSSTVAQSFWNFAQSTAVILPCSVQNFKMIARISKAIWTNEV